MRMVQQPRGVITATLDELDHHTVPAMRQHPCQHAKCRGGLAFAVTGVDDDEPVRGI